MKKKTEGSLA